MKDFKTSAKAYILSNIILGLVILGFYLAKVYSSDLWMLFLLSALASLSLIFKVVGATEGTHYQITFLIYSFTYFQLGLPATLVVMLVSNIIEWVWHKYPWYIQSFNIGQYAISLVGMDLVYSTLNPDHILARWMDILFAIAGMVAFTLVNHLLVGLVLWFVRQESLSKSGVMKPFPLVLDFTFWSLGAGAALIWQIEPLAVVLVVIPIYLMYSTLKVPALERKTETDPKTGLFNAQYFANALEAELNRANRFDRPLALVMADLDLLRNINNTYGHLAGDEVLIGVARILMENFREYDVISRFGGEEYAILMPETTPEEAFPRIDQIREKIASYNFVVPTSVTPISASISFGIAGRSDHNQNPKELIHSADLALYHAKSQGRNCTFIYTDEGIRDLFQTRDSIPTIDEAELEERIHHHSYKYRSSPLRDEPAPEVSQAGSETQSLSTPDDQNRPPAVSKSDHTTLKTNPNWIAPLYIILLTASAIGILIHSLLTIDHLLSGSHWFGLIVFGLLAFLAELYAVDIYIRNTSVSTSAAVLIGGTLLFGPPGAFFLSILFAMAAWIKHRSPLKRFVFNASNQMFTGIIFLSILSHAGYYFPELKFPGQFIVTILLSIFVYLTTTSLIALGIKLERGVPFRHTWMENFSWLGPYFIAMGVIGYALIFSYQKIGFIGLVVIIVPLLVLRYSQTLFIRRTKESVEKLNKTNQMLAATSAEVTKLNEKLLDVLSYVIDMRDPFLLGHSQQVVFYAVKIAEQLGLTPERIEIIRKGGLIHDIGKLGIPEGILGKKSQLTPEEYEIVKQHVNIGAKILQRSEALENVVPMVYHHHEHFDGSGYPEGLKGKEIPLEARILALADSIEAMASDRPYRSGATFDKILKEVEKNRGTHFDPQVVDAFFEIVKEMNEPFVVNTTEQVSSDVGFSFRDSLNSEATG